MAARGWIGMTWPKRYGGGERSSLERYVVLEEMLAAGAPVGAHWVADRQSGPLLMRYSPDVLAPRYVPQIVRGEAFFCIGMSEPDSGSDLASIRSKATRTADGWLINGRKVWTSRAHTAHYMIVLVRTGERSDNRHAGLSQLLLDMKTPGITVRPIINQLGEHDFNEVTFDDVRVPHDHLIGTEGEGWKQVGAELAFERSGPERYLSSTQLLLEMLDAADADDPRHAVALGRVVAHYATLRQMSLSIASMLSEGKLPDTEAALVKDLGTHFQQELPQIAREVMEALPASERKNTYRSIARSRHPGGARLHHPGRHHRDPARHHRARVGSAMSQVRDLLVSSARSIFETTVTKDVIDAAEAGRFPQQLWQAIEDSGLDLALAPEE